MLTIGSIFRDSASYVDRYFDQITRLREHMPVRLVLAEGDSTDGTYELIEQHLRHGDTLIRADHGGMKFESVDHPTRWAQIAWVYNQLLREVNVMDDDRFAVVESDLIWPTETMVRVVKDLDVVHAVAAMSMRGGIFYDVYGHRGLDGEAFTPHAPFHPSLAHAPVGAMVPIQSAGSCVAITGLIFNKGVEFDFDDCIRGYCRSIRQHTTLWLDTGAGVEHP